MANLTESNKRYIGNMHRAGMLSDAQFENTGGGYIATVTTADGAVHRFETSDQWNRWWDARCPRVSVGINPLSAR
jgi:hypothetical protein